MGILIIKIINWVGIFKKHVNKKKIFYFISFHGSQTRAKLVTCCILSPESFGFNRAASMDIRSNVKFVLSNGSQSN